MLASREIAHEQLLVTKLLGSVYHTPRRYWSEPKPARSSSGKADRRPQAIAARAAVQRRWARCQTRNRDGPLLLGFSRDRHRCPCSRARDRTSPPLPSADYPRAKRRLRGRKPRLSRPSSVVGRRPLYAGLVPTVHQSGGPAKIGHITKEGSSELRAIMIQAAHIASRPTTRNANELRAYLERIRGSRSRKKIALTALARHMLSIAFHIWRDGTEYDPQTNEVQHHQLRFNQDRRRSAKSVWVTPWMSWALVLRGLADPLSRMAPCDRAASPSTYGRMVTPDVAAPRHLEQRRLALPWFESSRLAR
ncbi:transposase [Enhygromyxa salina]|uniref:Transposase IS116/IS110/IS902 family protein n=1 Tax=Enhygromyxa salina TaxID=215803 RepID=A0A2S9YXE9_9BACT|nr:Transposase IS116/IS110/IS902 family protein [Enhygromyxa salina]